MHGAMVEPAQRGQVRQLGLAAVRPVLDVVPVHVTLVIAAREHAAFVARGQCATQRRRNTARLATDIERLALLVLGDLDLAAVARRGDARFRPGIAGPSSISQRPGLALAQRGIVDVHDDLVPIAAFHRRRAVLAASFRP